jgi:hypothetical protein
MRWLEAETLEKDAVNIPSTLAFFALRAQFESLLLKITNETELILEDNLASGEFVQSVGSSAKKHKESNPWEVDTQYLNPPLRQNDPPEYWGGKPLFGGDFVTSTDSFPWMRVEISKFTFS